MPAERLVLIQFIHLLKVFKLSLSNRGFPRSLKRIPHEARIICDGTEGFLIAKKRLGN